jgi:hypothetical protein
MFNWFKIKGSRPKIEKSILTDEHIIDEHINEILYVDEIRLNMYFEQISPPEKIEILTTKNLKAGFTSLGVDINENIRTRNYTTNEKLFIVEDHLRRNNQLLDGRPSEIYTFENKGPFIKETIKAQRIFLPPRKLLGRELNLWVADSEKQLDSWRPKDIPLFLVEDYTLRKRDSIPISSYSYLLLLKSGYGEEIRKTIIGDIPFADIVKLEEDPINTLIKFGAKALDKRNITVLYKVRASERCNCFGYPICIMET